MLYTREKGWWKDAAIYQIYPKSFRDSDGDGFGDLRGVREKLGYIKELGVDAIWLCPFFQSPQADNGYDISDYYRIDERFGTMDDLRELVDECHRLGLRFIMDLVANHTSDEHEWFQKALSGDEKYMDYYYFRDPVDGHEPSNWESVFGGSAWEYVPSLDKYYLHLFHVKQPDLNWTNDEVVRGVIDVMKHWCEFGVDGFRLDAINYLYKEPGFPDAEPEPGHKYAFAAQYYANKPMVNEYFARLNREVFGPYNLMTVAEVGHMDPEIARQYCGKERDEVDMVYLFDMLNFDQEGYDKFRPTGFDLEKFKNTMFYWEDEMKEHGHLALFLSNHDQTRNVGRFGDDSDRYRYLSSRMQACTMYMLRGTPYIYQGEELAMTFLDYEGIEDFNDIEVMNTWRERVVEGGEDPSELIRIFNTRSRDCPRSPMQWDGGKNAGFTTGTPWQKVNGNYPGINAALEEKDGKSTLHFYRKLLRVRKTLKSVLEGDVVPFERDNPSCFCYMRTCPEETSVCVSNFTAQERYACLPDGVFDVVLSNYGEEGQVRGCVMLRPYETLFAVRH